MVAAVWIINPLLHNHFAPMKITITASEILDKYDWDKFCEIKGLNPWAIAEGLMDSSEEFNLTLEEARAIGITSIAKHEDIS